MGLRCAIALLCLTALFEVGPSFIQRFGLSRLNKLRDFYQDYASARNFLEGVTVYDDHARSVPRDLGPDYLRTRNYHSFVTLNAHPPSSVLLMVPLAHFDYARAFLTWNIISFGAFVVSLSLMACVLKAPISPWGVMLLVSALLVCNPLRKQIYQGQLSSILLLLLVGSWALERSGRDGAAGVLIGVATAIKLFPAFLFLHFALQRRWRVLGWGLATLAVVLDLTAIVLDPKVFSDYVSTVMPQVQSFRAWWPNASLTGFWSKLLDPVRPAIPEGYHVVPLAKQPGLALVGTLVCMGVVTFASVRVSMRARSLAGRDCAFGVAVVSMLLVCPLTWDHYFLILTIPAAINLRHRRGPSIAAATLLTLGVLWLDPALLPWMLIPPGSKTTLFHTVTVFSILTYALIGFFAATWVQARRLEARGRREADVEFHRGSWREGPGAVATLEFDRSAGQ